VAYDVFNHLTNLLYLDLRDNLIYSLDERVFSKLRKLKFLDLSFNKLHILPDRLLSSQENLERLLLDGNRLTAVSVKLLTPLRSIGQLGLGYNRFVCNCELLHTVFWCEERGLYTVASCRYQSSGNEVRWTELTHSRLCSENELPDVPSTRHTNLTKSCDVPEPDTSSHLFLWVTVIVLTILLLMCCGLSAVLYYKRRTGTSAAPAGDTPVYDDIATVRYYDYIHV
jgi:Leucine-rich repeat (LRR) protein